MQLFNNALKVILLSGVMVLVGCAKEDPEIEDPQADPIPSVPPYFAWQTDGGPTKVADSSFAYLQSHVLFAFKNTGEGIEVNLASLSTGTYEISSAQGNQLQYDDGSATYDGTGTFVISGVQSGRMSGHFNCTFSGPAPAAITGTFSEIPRR